MKKFLMTTAILSTLIGAAVVTSNPAPAQAQGFNFSFDTGNVAMAFRDGYYDHDRRWHRWHSAREHREFRNRYRTNYYDRRHRDSDGDGVPDRFDRRPNNPWRN